MKKLFMPLLLIIVTLGFISCGAGKSKSETATATATESIQVNVFAGHENDAALFAEMYPVSKDNPFIIATFDEVVYHLRYGTGIIAFGFEICPRCNNAFPTLEKAYNKMNMSRYSGFRGKIVYYDFFADREANNERYKILIDLLKDFLPNDAHGNPRLYSPDIFFVASGRIVGNHLDTVPSLTNPRDRLNEEQEAELMAIYVDLIQKVEDCEC